MPKISIITPSYNRGWSIEACLKSLQAQTFTDYEHIIVDGGSSDSSLEIVNSYKEHDPRISLISEPDLGMYDAINKGLQRARGEIVAYLNTDDFYLPEALLNIVREFDSKPNLDLIYGNWFSWYPEKTSVEFLPVRKFSKYDMAIFATLPQPSVFFKRSVLDLAASFDLKYKLVADNEFFSRIMCLGITSKHIDYYISGQTVHSGNLLVGNDNATYEALNECENYRVKRQKKLLDSNKKFKNSLMLIISKIRKLSFPFEWRFGLIIHFAKSILFVGKILYFPWKFKFGRFSYKSLFYYLLPSGIRKVGPFYIVNSDQFKSYLRFSPPDPNKK